MGSEWPFAVARDWQLSTVGDLCRAGGGDVQTGPFGSQLHARDYVDDGIPMVMPQDLVGGRVDVTKIARIAVADRDRLERYALTSGDIVYSRRGDLRRRALVTEDEAGWLCGTGCLRVRVGAGCDPRFLFCALGHPSIQEWIERHAVGATMPNLNTDILSRCPIAAPSMREQRAIADVLGALDDKIEGNRRLAATHEDVAAALTWVVARFANQPDTWTRLPFADAVDINPRVKIVRGTRVPFIEMAAVEPFATRPTFLGERQFSGGAKFEPGDTLMARITGCIEHGKGAFVDFIDERGAGSTEFFVLRAKPPLTPEVVFFLSRDPRLRAHAIANMTGTSGRQRVDKACFNHIQVALAPDSPERRDALQALEQAMRTTRALWRESRTLTAIRDALLPKLVSGQIRVPLSEDPEEMVGSAVDALDGAAAGSRGAK